MRNGGDGGGRSIPRVLRTMMSWILSKRCTGNGLGLELCIRTCGRMSWIRIELEYLSCLVVTSFMIFVFIVETRDVEQDRGILV